MPVYTVNSEKKVQVRETDAQYKKYTQDCPSFAMPPNTYKLLRVVTTWLAKIIKNAIKMLKQPHRCHGSRTFIVQSLFNSIEHLLLTSLLITLVLDIYG